MAFEAIMKIIHGQPLLPCPFAETALAIVNLAQSYECVDLIVKYIMGWARREYRDQSKDTEVWWERMIIALNMGNRVCFHAAAYHLIRYEQFRFHRFVDMKRFDKVLQRSGINETMQSELASKCLTYYTGVLKASE